MDVEKTNRVTSQTPLSSHSSTKPTGVVSTTYKLKKCSFWEILGGPIIRVWKE